MTATLHSRENPWSVAVINKELAGYLRKLSQVWIEGEITSWSLRGGHVYGRLRDLHENASLEFTIWKSVMARQEGTFHPGDRVVLLANPDYWVVGGKLSFNVKAISHVGVGELLERLERLRRSLASEGLFRPEHKKPLPFLPQLIGLVTGKDSDAEKDVRQNALLRWPDVRFRTEYASVQGDRAVPEVIRALETLDSDPEVDVIIIARGGGDFLHLLPFSDEKLVRAVFAATTPIVSAIGHENDRPLLDEVADLRASTPTDAAKRVVPDVSEERAALSDARSRLSGRINHLLAIEIDRLTQIRTRSVMAQPGRMLDPHVEDIARLQTRAEELVERRIADCSQHLDHARANLRALSPLKTLERGYAIVQHSDGSVLVDPHAAPGGDTLTVTLAGGRLRARSEGPVD